MQLAAFMSFHAFYAFSAFSAFHKLGLYRRLTT